MTQEDVDEAIAGTHSGLRVKFAHASVSGASASPANYWASTLGSFDGLGFSKVDHVVEGRDSAVWPWTAPIQAPSSGIGIAMTMIHCFGGGSVDPGTPEVDVWGHLTGNSPLISPGNAGGSVQSGAGGPRTASAGSGEGWGAVGSVMVELE